MAIRVSKFGSMVFRVVEGEKAWFENETVWLKMERRVWIMKGARYGVFAKKSKLSYGRLLKAVCSINPIQKSKRVLRDLTMAATFRSLKVTIGSREYFF